MAEAVAVNGRNPAPVRWVLPGILGLAAVLRLLQYFQGRPLWQDEAMLALNFGKHSFLLLLRPLEYGQAAPPLFLWAVEAVTRAAGMSEYALRFLPLVAGLLIPWLVWRTAKQLAGVEAALIAATLAAVSVLLIRYSVEIKQYGVDAFVSIALAFLAVRIRARPDHGLRWWQLFGASLAGMALSFTAVFALAGGLASLLADAAIRAERARLRRLMLLGGGLAAGFLIFFLVFYLPHAGSAEMLSYWGETFLRPGTPGFFHRLYWLAQSLADAFPGLPDQLQVRVQCAMLLLGGLGIIRRGGLPAAAQIVVPLAAFTLGALMTPFPITDRLQLFLAPFSCIAGGVVVAEALRLLRLRPSLVAVGGVLLMAAWGAPSVLGYVKSPIPVAESREPVRLIAGSEDRSPVYVTNEAVSLWAYYSTDWTRPDQARLDRLARSVASSLDAEGRLELVGAPSGMVFTGARRYSRDSPTPGWAAGEVDRIAAAAHPSVWVFSSMGNTSLVDSLRLEFARRGMPVNEIRKGRKVALLRVFAASGLRTEPR